MLDKNWKGLIKPKKIDVINSDYDKNSATLVIEPLEKGFGITLGNALRRIMLSSLWGMSITSVKIADALHEFTTIKGVKEDVVNILLNIKKIALKSTSLESGRLTISVKGPKIVTAADIKTDNGIEVINKDMVICHLAENHDLNIEMKAELGKGYRMVNDKVTTDKPIGEILIDALFSPILKVAYKVSDSRVGKVTDYDRLAMDIVTNGSMLPEEAIELAAKILQDQLSFFINFDDSPPDEEEPSYKKQDVLFNRNLLRKIDELEFSVRSANCLKNDNVLYVGDLVQKSEMDMLRTPNFGRKSLNEIKEVLGKMGLHLGMSVSGWPPKDIEKLSKKLHDVV